MVLPEQFDGNWYAGAVQNGTDNASNNFTNTDFIFANKRDNTNSELCELRAMAQSSYRMRLVFNSGTSDSTKTVDSNTLDDYEEGTVSAVTYIAPGATGVSEANQSRLTYTKIGDVVYCRLAISAKCGAAGSGQIQIEGLPFVVRAGGTPANSNFVSNVNMGLCVQTGVASSWANSELPYAVSPRPGTNRLFVYKNNNGEFLDAADLVVTTRSDFNSVEATFFYNTDS